MNSVEIGPVRDNSDRHAGIEHSCAIDPSSPGWCWGSWGPGRATCAGWSGSWHVLDPCMSSFSMRGNTVCPYVAACPGLTWLTWNRTPVRDVYSKLTAAFWSGKKKHVHFSALHRYKIIELLAYVAMGVLPALVILSMVRNSSIIFLGHSFRVLWGQRSINCWPVDEVYIKYNCKKKSAIWIWGIKISQRQHVVVVLL